MFSIVFDYFSKFVACLSPIICAWIAWKAQTTQKKTKEFMELQTKYNAELESRKTLEAKAQQELLDKMQKSIDGLTKDVKTLKEAVDLDGMKKSISDTKQIVRSNLAYTQSISQVICSLANIIESAHVGDASAIQEIIATHRDTERKIMSKITDVALLE